MKRLFLHAARLSLRHPLGEQKLNFEAKLPEEMSAFVKKAFR